MKYLKLSLFIVVLMLIQLSAIALAFQCSDAINMLGDVDVGDVVDVTVTGDFMSGGCFSETLPITVVSGSLRGPENIIETTCYQNVPNPFNPETWIPYQLGSEVAVDISIYDTSGRLVRTLALGNKPPGYYIGKDKAAYWDGKNESGEAVSSGVYFYTVQAGDFTITKKMIVLR
jgi:hypothetical protein